MRTLLVCKGEYRYFFPQVARELASRHGCDVSVIAFASPTARMLEKTGTFKNVFNLAAYLKKEVPRLHLEECVASLQEMEFAGEAANFNMMIHADRIIRRYPCEQAIRILAAVRQFCSELLHEVRPAAVLGEIACATEWVLWSLGRHMDIAYLAPYPTPVAKKFFFLGAADGMWEQMARLFEIADKKGLSPEQTTVAEEFLCNFQAQKSKPPFLSWAQRSPLVPNVRELALRAARIPFRLQTFCEDGQYEVGSFHGTPPWRPIWEDAIRIARHAVSEAAIFEREINQGPKVYFPLHVQPEFTTDIRAPFFTNQISLIESISKSVPIGYRVIVKEHPGMKGERRLAYYREINRLHNVQLLSPSVDSHEVIRQSDAVLTITGTSAWEAILYQKPVIAFGPLCYGFGDLVYRCQNVVNLPAILRDAIHDFKPNHGQILKLVWALLASAYELEWGDPIRRPQLVEKANVERIADAIVSEMSFRASLHPIDAVPA